MRNIISLKELSKQTQNISIKCEHLVFNSKNPSHHWGSMSKGWAEFPYDSSNGEYREL